MNSKYLTLFSPFLLVIFINTLCAQNKYTYTLQNSAYWADSQNWICTGSIGNCPPGFTINASDTVVIDGYCVINPNMTVTNHGTLIITENSTLTIEEVGDIENYSKLDIFGYLYTESGDFQHHSGSNITIHEQGIYTVGFLGAARFNMGSNLLINGELTIEMGGNAFLGPGAIITLGSTGQWIIL